MEPWMCPRCGQVWAGWVAKCDCTPPLLTTTTGTAQIGIVRYVKRETKTNERWPEDVLRLLARERYGA